MSEPATFFSGPIQAGVSAYGEICIRVSGDNNRPETPANLSAMANLISELGKAHIQHTVMYRKDPEGNHIPDAVRISTLK